MGINSGRERAWWVVMLLIVLLALGFNGGEGCLEQEREGLLKLKEAFNYPNGNSLPSWNNLTLSTDCCTWEGVFCDNSTHRVISLFLNYTRGYKLRDIKWSLNASYFLPFQQLQELHLSGNYLSGLFGEVRLDNLQFLDLSDNRLTKVPSFDLSHSRNLEELDFGSNYLEGNLPESIMSLTSLTNLSLNHNYLNGSLPQQGALCNLKNLVSLDLAYNVFEGQLPACLTNLTSLRELVLQYSGFEGNFPSSLFHSWRSLVLVSISDNYFSGSFSFSLLANHSNLKVFWISCSNTNLKLETENPPFIPSFQLRLFRIDNCSLNEANNNKMPTFLLHQYDLIDLELTSLNISGTFPYWLLANNTKLNMFNLTHNLFTGPFKLNSTSKLFQLQFFDVSSNPIKYQIPYHIGSIFPNLISLDISSSSLQGPFPASIGEMRQLNDLDLSNNNLSRNLPQEFGKGSKELRVLKLSNNNLSGPCLPIGSNFTYLLLLDLSNNNFVGKVPYEIVKSLKLRMLDLSANHLFSEIPSWIGNFQDLSYLILSKNSLTSSIPKSFCNLTNLAYLDLSQNEFNGTLPSCLNMPLLKYLHLQSNHFMGPIPSTLANSPLLLTLDLTGNKFSGQFPILFSSFLNLRVLMLKDNRLEGFIPISLCELKNISILDISQNKLSGGIPYCVNNITFGRRDALGETKVGNFIVSWIARISCYSVDSQTGEVDTVEDKYDVTLNRNQEVDFTSKGRYESYKGSILDFMSGLDFSDNHLTGEIPSQIGFLSTIHTLNLSNNHLTGPIPETFSNLKQIESLDLSHNKLLGRLPAQLIELYSLSAFSVAYNNLSGKTPDMKNQFATFEPISYEGNPFLCGPPLPQLCSSLDKPATGRNLRPYHSEDDDFRVAFLWTFAGAFAVSFLGTVFFLYRKSYVLLVLSLKIINKFSV